MTDDHIEAFIRESEESIVELNNSLLALEDDPTDEEAMERIFRTAHTLKGNFSAIGFEDESSLAHAIEDLLDEIREGRMAVTPEIMDHIFEGVDLLEVALDQIDENGESSIDPDETIAAIREIIEEGGTGENVDGDGTGTAGEDPGGSGTATDDPVEDGDESDDAQTGTEAVRETIAALDDPASIAEIDGGVVHVEVGLGETEMPGVDGMLVLESVTDELDLLDTLPSPQAIQDGNFEDAFDLFVGSDDAGAVEDEISDLSNVASASATDVTPILDDLDASGSEDEADATGAVEEDEADDENAAEGDASEGDTGRVGGDEGGPGGEEMDEAVKEARTSVDDIKSVRVDVDLLDELYGLVEQLVTSRIKLRRAVDDGDVDRASDNLDELDKITSSLQNTVMDMRLIPLKKVVNTFPRMVRDLARDQGKEIDFEMEGTDVELDRTILDEIADPLMHVLRNAVDHGIESPEVREEKGKPREGKIRLWASRERDHVTITVEDDGGGLDVEAIREKAAEKGVRDRTELEAMDDSEVYDLIFHPGFSTSEEVTDVSGRGVGMDVVHSTVNRLDGSVSVQSEPDEGTSVTLRLPVSVAIVRVLFVDVGEREYGIPIKNVDEITRMNGVKTVNGDEVISHDDDIYPVIRLGQAFDIDGASRNGDGMLVRIRESERQVALHCDAVKRQEEVVIKPFEGELSDVSGLSGTAVIGDGNVVPILDVATL